MAGVFKLLFLLICLWVRPSYSAFISTYLSISALENSDCQKDSCQTDACFIQKVTQIKSKDPESHVCLTGPKGYYREEVKVGSKISSCAETRVSGVYLTSIEGTTTNVFCKVDPTGQWTVIQRRQDGSIDFYRDWDTYKEGFGSIDGEHWFGNDRIHALTTTAGQTRLRVDLESMENEKYTVYYDNFAVAEEAEKYRMTVGAFDGASPPGDSLAIHQGMRFSTFDQDNDLDFGKGCANAYWGGWWYNYCHAANLNGRYNNRLNGEGVIWFTWKGHYYSLKKVAMMIRKPN